MGQGGRGRDLGNSAALRRPDLEHLSAGKLSKPGAEEGEGWGGGQGGQGPWPHAPCGHREALGQSF